MASFRTLAVVAFCVVLAACSKINQETIPSSRPA